MHQYSTLLAHRWPVPWAELVSVVSPLLNGGSAFQVKSCSRVIESSIGLRGQYVAYDHKHTITLFCHARLWVGLDGVVHYHKVPRDRWLVNTIKGDVSPACQVEYVAHGIPTEYWLWCPHQGDILLRIVANRGLCALSPIDELGCHSGVETTRVAGIKHLCRVVGVLRGGKDTTVKIPHTVQYVQLLNFVLWHSTASHKKDNLKG